MEALTPTELRRDVYGILDEILLTGRSREVVRDGKRLLLVAAEPSARRRQIDEMPRRRYLRCSARELVETRWDYDPDADE